MRKELDKKNSELIIETVREIRRLKKLLSALFKINTDNATFRPDQKVIFVNTQFNKGVVAGIKYSHKKGWRYRVFPCDNNWKPISNYIMVNENEIADYLSINENKNGWYTFYKL